MYSSSAYQYDFITSGLPRLMAYNKMDISHGPKNRLKPVGKPKNVLLVPRGSKHTRDGGLSVT